MTQKNDRPPITPITLMFIRLLRRERRGVKPFLEPLTRKAKPTAGWDDAEEHSSADYADFADFIRVSHQAEPGCVETILRAVDEKDEVNRRANPESV